MVNRMPFGFPYAFNGLERSVSLFMALYVGDGLDFQRLEPGHDELQPVVICGHAAAR